MHEKNIRNPVFTGVSVRPLSGVDDFDQYLMCNYVAEIMKQISSCRLSIFLSMNCTTFPAKNSNFR